MKNKEYKANVNLEILFNGSDMSYNKSLCEIKLKYILRMFEEMLEKLDIDYLVRSYEIEEDVDSFGVYTDKIKESNALTSWKDELSSNMVNLLINALGEKFNNNFMKEDKIEAKQENDTILKIIRGLVEDDE